MGVVRVSDVGLCFPVIKQNTGHVILTYTLSFYKGEERQRVCVCVTNKLQGAFVGSQLQAREHREPQIDSTDQSHKGLQTQRHRLPK